MIWYHTLLFALIQALTEFLPVSSSGHLLFMKGLLHLEEMPMIYDVLVHTGSLAAVLIFYFSRIRSTLTGSMAEIRRREEPKNQTRFLVYALISTAVTFACYVLFQESIETSFETPAVLPYTYLITSAVLILTRWIGSGKEKGISEQAWAFALIIGLVQAMAMLPGISRSGSTIAVMLMLGVRKQEAAYYSFILFIPAVLGALLFQLLDLPGLQAASAQWKSWLLAFAAAAVFSYVCLSLLTWIVRRGRLWIFAGYTIFLSVLAWILF
ncbi:undecaprenyl-diphosphate phosphatase [bacterium]|nr:undecaprenyl-diphosphate phosphatase [bacterium]